MSRKTPLYENHLKAKGKMVEFCGWLLPTEYESLISEHANVRKSVGLFDVSHMGEIFVEGHKAKDFLQKTTTNNVENLKDNQIQYSAMCYEDGGIIDDVLVHRVNEKTYFLCVNCANLEKDYKWLQENNSEGVRITDQSNDFAQLAIQGPQAIELLQKLTKIDLESIPRYWFVKGELSGIKELFITRTGYTGEDGIEIYVKPEYASSLWEEILDKGKTFGIKPCGLGARDTLRLEAKYALYGNDIDKTTIPHEAGLFWIVSKKKGDFIGRKAMYERKERGLTRKLVGLAMVDRGIARKGYQIFNNTDENIGAITSGTYSPSLKKPIALGYVKKEFSAVDTSIKVEIRGKKVKAVVVKTPFISGTSLDKFLKKEV